MTLPTNQGVRGATGLDRETRRELAKLPATFLNGLAVAVIAVGGLAPAVANLSQIDPVSRSGLVLAAIGLISFLLGVPLHPTARGVLRREYSR